MITFGFDGLGKDHYAIYIRTVISTDCAGSVPFGFIVNGQTLTPTNAPTLDSLIESTIISHNLNYLNLGVDADSSSNTCSSITFQDMGIYILKCMPGCATCADSISCLTCIDVYYFDTTTNTCIASCGSLLL